MKKLVAIGIKKAKNKIMELVYDADAFKAKKEALKAGTSSAGSKTLTKAIQT